MDSETIDQYVKKFEALHYLETSAKKAKNTDRIFSQLVQSIIDQALPSEFITIL